MDLNSATNEPDINHDFATTSGGWNQVTTSEIISFVGGCSTDVNVPTSCVVTTDATCTSSSTNWDENKVKCQISSNPAY